MIVAPGMGETPGKADHWLTPNVVRGDDSSPQQVAPLGIRLGALSVHVFASPVVVPSPIYTIQQFAPRDNYFFTLLTSENHACFFASLDSH